MTRIELKIEPFPAAQIPRALEARGILVNRYAEAYFSHPRFSISHTGIMAVTVAALEEIGLEGGATLDELFRHIRGIGLKPCPPCTGLFLRLAWRDQPQSQNAILTGTHNVPDQAVTVLSEILEPDDAFPKGLYLRKVDGRLWLRGYVCDMTYRFPGDARFAFQDGGTGTETAART